MCHHYETNELTERERALEGEATEETPEDERELDEEPGELQEESEPVAPSTDD